MMTVFKTLSAWSQGLTIFDSKKLPAGSQPGTRLAECIVEHWHLCIKHTMSQEILECLMLEQNNRTCLYVSVNDSSKLTYLLASFNFIA